MMHIRSDNVQQDAANNKEMHRRIVVEIVSIVENLFSKFLLKAISKIFYEHKIC